MGFILNNGKYEIEHDPNAVLDYSRDWTDWLGATDTIATASWTKSGSIVIGTSQVDPTGKVATVWISGGTAGEKCSLTCHITTTEGRQDDRTYYLKVKER